MASQLPLDDLERALRSILPAEHRERASDLASAIIAAAEGESRPPADTSLHSALHALSGKAVQTADMLISFRDTQLGDVAIGDVAGGNLVKFNLILPPTTLAPQLSRYRQAMLKKVRAIWVDGLLRQSLTETVRIELGLSERPDAVQLPLNTQYQELRRPARDLPLGVSMIDVFDEANHALLILGAPGSGKTTLLLQLCRDLLDRAASDPGQPIPVIFNLSSWAARREPLDRWLVEELNNKYDIPRTIARGWVADDLLLPLLDGLDEVAPGQRPACVDAINTYRGAHLVPLTITSRLADYEALATRLRLQRAVLVRALSEEQINAYLGYAPESLANLQAAILRNSELRETATTPLMLNVLALAYSHHSIERPGVAPSMERIWDLFIIQLLRRRRTIDGMGTAQFLRRLAGIARVLQRMGQSIFYIEQLQPEALPDRRWRYYYSLIDRLGWSLLGALVVSVLSGLILSWSLIPGYGLSMGPVVGALSGTLMAIFSVPANTARGTRRTLRARVGAAASGWLAYGGAISGLFMVALLVYFASISRIDGPLWLMLQNAYSRMLFFLINDAVWQPLSLGESIRYSAFVGVAAGTTLGLAGAMAGVFGLWPSLSLRRVNIIETLRWSGTHAWEGLRAGLGFGLVAGAVFAGEVAISVIATGLNDPFRGAMIMWGFSIVACAGLGALLSGLTAPTLGTTMKPNQGIYRSMRSAVVGGVIGGLTVGATLGAAIQIGLPLTFGRSIESIFQNTVPAYLYLGGVIGVVSGLASALAFGGYAVLSHVALRLALWRSGVLPLRLTPFLNICADHALLRHIGGGYIFTHRLLLEHIAAMTGEDIARLSSEIAAAQSPDEASA